MVDFFTKSLKRKYYFAIGVLVTAAIGYLWGSLSNSGYQDAIAAIPQPPPYDSDDEGDGDPTTAPVAYVGATLIDGTKATPVEDATVLIHGRKIVAVGKEVEIPAGAEIVDVAGKWIVPGLIDAHAHYTVSGRLYTRPRAMNFEHAVPYEEEVRWIHMRLPVTMRGVLCAGVTSVLSAGGPSIEYEARAHERVMNDAPTSFVAHGMFLMVPPFLANKFFPPFDGQPIPKSITTKELAIAAVNEAVIRKADLIKTAVDSRGSRVLEFLQRDYKEIHKVFVAEAAKHDLKITTHIHYLEPARELIKLGVDSLQHIPFDKVVDEEFVQLAKAAGTVIVPTISLMERSFAEIPSQQFNFEPIEHQCGDPEVTKTWFEVGQGAPLQENFVNYPKRTEIVKQNTKILYEAGVPIAAGTDAGMMGMLLGASMHLELRSLIEIGMTPQDAIIAATHHSAIAAGKEKHYGTVEESKFADFIVLSANPLENIRNMQTIDLIVKHGMSFTQQDLMPPGAGRIVQANQK